MTAPANDNWADAITLTGASGTLTGQSNLDAAAETGEPSAFSGTATNTIWYKITPGDGPVTVDTAGSLEQAPGSGEYDTVLSVYTGSAVDALSFVAGNDDSVGYTSSVSWAAVAGATYYVRVHGYSGGDVSDQIVINWALADWGWVDLGGLPDGTADFGVVTSSAPRKVFYTAWRDNFIRGAEYPSVAPLNDKNTGTGSGDYVYGFDNALGPPRHIVGMTLLPEDMLFVLVERQSASPALSAAEGWVFDTSDPDDPGTRVFEDEDELGTGSGTMRGHIAYNPADGRIYIAETYGYSDTTPFVAYFTSLASLDTSTWTRINHRTYYNPTYVYRGISATPDGAVWYQTSDARLRRYDPSSDTETDLVVDPTIYTDDTMSMPDSSVVGMGTSGIRRFEFSVGALAEIDAAEVFDHPTGYWSGSHGAGGAGESWVFDGTNLWTYSVRGAPKTGCTMTLGSRVLAVPVSGGNDWAVCCLGGV